LNASNSDKPWRIVNGLNDNYPVLNFQNLGIQEYTSKELNLKIYPTITEKLLHIQSNAKVLDYKIYDINGRIIPINNKKMKEIDVSSFTKGVYIISVSTNEGTKNLKFIKK
ncbi:T9SS type A sorting domain-containing protein, partial [uncultured Empedobacter sp.]